MRKHKLLLLLVILTLIVVALITYVSMLFFKGDVSNYKPPQPSSASSTELVRADLQSLSQNIDAYFIKNMEHPQKLELLQPEFIDRVPFEPLSKKPYQYTLYDADGVSRYRISVPDPKLYNAREFYIEDGKLVQN